MERQKSFTGHSRRRVTRFSVRLGEFLSRWLITVGGLGTILAVILVGVFLVWVAAPLFRTPSVTAGPTVRVTPTAARLPRFGADEYQLLGWAFFSDGTVRVVRLDTGEQLSQLKVIDADEQLTACSPPGPTTDVALGFAGGKARLGHVSFTTSFLKEVQVNDRLRELPQGAIAEYEGGLVSRTPEGQFRVQKIEAEAGDPVKLDNTSPVVQLDLSMRGEADDSEGSLSFLTADGQLHTYTGKKALSVATSNIFFKVDLGGSLDLSAQTAAARPTHVLLSGVGDNVFVAWDDGRCVRVNTQEVETPQAVEAFNFVGSDGGRLTALGRVEE